MLSLTADVQQELLLHLCLVLPALGFIRCGQAALQGELLSRKCAVQQVTAPASEVDAPVLQGAWEGGRGVTALLCQLQPSGVTMGIVCLTLMALMASGQLQLCDNQLTAPPAPKGHPQLLTAGKCRNPGCRVQMWVGNHTDRPCVLGQVHSYGPAVRDVLGEAEPAVLICPSSSTGTTCRAGALLQTPLSLLTRSGTDFPIVSLTCTAVTAPEVE